MKKYHIGFFSNYVTTVKLNWKFECDETHEDISYIFSDKSGFSNRHVPLWNIIENQNVMKSHTRLWSEFSHKSGFPNRHVAVLLSMSRTTCSPGARRLVYQTKPVPHNFHGFLFWKSMIEYKEISFVNFIKQNQFCPIPITLSPFFYFVSIWKIRLVRSACQGGLKANVFSE